MNIDSIARWYQWLEYLSFGQQLENSRSFFLPALRDCHRILILGEGDGRNLQKILSVAPHAEIRVVEQSPVMIALAQSRIAAADTRVRFHQADARTLQWEQSCCDAILTPFFLDCFHQEEADILIQRLSTALRPGGVWLITDFSIPQRGWRKWHAGLWIALMYRFFRWTTGLNPQRLPQWSHHLEKSGLQLRQKKCFRAGLIQAEYWVKTASNEDFPTLDSPFVNKK